MWPYFEPYGVVSWSQGAVSTHTPLPVWLASVILYPGSKDEGGDGADDEETEVRVQKKVGTKTVETDEDIQTVKGLLSDFSFSGYKVEPVAIKCESDDVEIGGEVLNTAHYNEIEKWKKFFFGKKLTRARMQGANSDPEERKLRSELQDVCHHIDKREKPTSAL